MKILGLDNREYSIKLPKIEKENCSSLHKLAREILSELYPLYLIYEEVYIPNPKLYLDFFIPQRHMVIEVHGKQHYERSSLFHSHLSTFLHGKTKDNLKRHWCEHNNFTLIELPYNRTKEWKKMLST